MDNIERDRLRLLYLGEMEGESLTESSILSVDGFEICHGACLDVWSCQVGGESLRGGGMGEDGDAISGSVVGYFLRLR